MHPKSNAVVNLFETFACFFRSSSQPKIKPGVSENGSRRGAAKEAPNENPSRRERRPRQLILTDESFEITVVGRSTESGGCLGRMNPPDQD